MTYPRNYGIIVNPDILAHDYIPPNILSRETHLEELKFCLSPTLKRNKPIHAWLYGKPGSGKTVTARYLLYQVQSTHGIKGVYINCWEHPTFYSVLDKLVLDLRILGADKPDASFKLERLERFIKDEPMVIVLDEIDRPSPKERNSILYNLCNLPKVGLVCICDSRYSLFSLDERIKSRLNPTQIEFKPYSLDEIVSIVTSRAESGLKPQTWDEGILSEIAGLAEGDPRLAIQTLKNAAYFAERENAEKIDRVHVEKGWNDAKAIRWSYLLKKLTKDHGMLFEIIKARKEILFNELWTMYLGKCKRKKHKPIALRTYSEYVNKLRDLGLITAERARVRGKVRVLRVGG